MVRGFIGDGRIFGGFPPFLRFVLLKAPRLATFFIAPKNCIFLGAFFQPIKKLPTLGAQKLQGFHGTPLYHCYTLQYINPQHTARPNHVKIFKGWPPRDASSKLVQLWLKTFSFYQRSQVLLWYKIFQHDQRGQIEMKKPTRLSNKSSTV